MPSSHSIGLKTRLFMFLSAIFFLGALLALGLAGPQPASAQAAAFELRDGDRVVLLGSTLIEREQSYGYWETMLAARNAKKNLVFRNLGWSGDTVFADARGGFGTPADGFRETKELVEALKPTVIFACYGANEAFEGEAGLPRFRQGLAALLDMLEGTRARLCLIAPPPQEKLGPPLPDPAPYNRSLALYRNVLKETAAQRGCGFVDLFDLVSQLKLHAGEHLTDNGIHLTAYGYWRTAEALAQGLGLPPAETHANFSAQQTAAGKPVRFGLAQLPSPSPSGEAATDASFGGAQFTVGAKGLAPGRHILRIDGKPAATASAEQWAEGVVLESGPDFDQAEKLRQAIVRKNELYFHRWRPQNVTYLFGFRKHEQGQNAKEIVEFDPLIAAEEETIRKLKTPAAHDYEFVNAK